MPEMDKLKKEYENIQVPPGVDFTLEKAIRRGRRAKLIRRVSKPAAIAASLALIFIVTANLLPGLGLLNKDLQEGSHTTYVEPGEGGIISSALRVELDIKEQIQQSQIIVRGMVVEILDTVKTQDLTPEPELGFLHSDVVIAVDEYLGPNQLPFDHVVIRHVGGKLDGHIHTRVGQENFTVGEDIIIFRLDQPEAMTQAPDGYVQEQYFLFHSRSKFINLVGESYVPDFTDANPLYRQLHRITVSKIRDLAE